MCVQLYLNYKLKSVAHLPWRQMTYKFLNTIIDDLFAFVIKMPLLHRLSVFRCDPAEISNRATGIQRCAHTHTHTHTRGETRLRNAAE